MHYDANMSDAIARVNRIGLISECSVLATGSIALVGKVFEHFNV